MLNIIFQVCMSLEDAAKLLDKKIIRNPDIEFEFKSRKHDLNKDEFFKRCLLEVDECDIPMDNVARDLLTGRTHSFDRISTGVKTLWLLKNYGDDCLLESCKLGPNCYKLAVEISKDKDIYLYDNSDMMVNEEADECVGEFKDYITGDVIEFGEDRAFHYIGKRGY